MIDIFGATISPNLFPRDLPVNVNGVSRVQITQFSANTVRLTLTLSPESSNWQASASPSGGLVVLPQAGGSTPSGQPSVPGGQPSVPGGQPSV
ncbi:MAG: N-acetylmuramoyl-L-alanine amidase, partial [Leptolyngbya sp. ERB_1_2]